MSLMNVRPQLVPRSTPFDPRHGHLNGQCHRRLPGFTLIELLVAMSVAVIVMGIIIVGLSQALGGTETRATQTALETGRSMLNDFLSDPQNRNRFYRQILRSPTGFNGTGPIAQPGFVNTGSSGRTDQTMDSSRRMINLLLSVSSNRASVQSLPSNRVEIDNLTRTSTAVVTRDAANAITTTSLLDAWNNPILLVPDGFEDATGLPVGTGGLSGVTAGGATGQIIRSPERKPFFASAGADGDFRTGDDNVYSFEN